MTVGMLPAVAAAWGAKNTQAASDAIASGVNEDTLLRLVSLSKLIRELKSEPSLRIRAGVRQASLDMRREVIAR